MENHEIPLHEALDPIATHYGFIPKWLVGTLRKKGILLNRDECRAPMQWNDGPNAGFSTATPWLPVHPTSARVNVAAQERDPGSLLHCYRTLLAVRRRSPALQSGTLEWIDDDGMSKDVVAYRRVQREDGREERAEVFLNFSPRTIPITLDVPNGGELVSTKGGERAPAPRSYALGPYEGVVVVTGG